MRIKFKRDTAFRKQFFVPDSFAHPAKMDAQLLIWIVEHYTKAGETILDPMAGSGTTMLACTLGRNVVLVELEEKFCKMMWDNWELVKMRPQLGSTMGACEIIQGDARQLEGLLVDKCIFSPPYAETAHHTEEHDDDYLRPDRSSRLAGTAGDNPDNIANKPYGNIDSIITSPPYEGSEARDRSKEDWWDEEREKKFSGGSAKIAKGYQADSIITSPPYEGSIDKGNENFEGIKLHQAGMSRKELLAIRRDAQLGYGGTTNNIGNLKSDSYLEAMLQVYQQCFSMLKDSGLMILVVKPFIRNQKLVPLQEDTKQLCRQAGFSFFEEHQRILPSQSFWRVIYAKRFPNAPKIDCEYVLIFKK